MSSDFVWFGFVSCQGEGQMERERRSLAEDWESSKGKPTGEQRDFPLSVCDSAAPHWFAPCLGAASVSNQANHAEFDVFLRWTSVGVLTRTLEKNKPSRKQQMQSYRISFSSCVAVCRVRWLSRFRQSDGHGDRRTIARWCQHAKESSRRGSHTGQRAL